MDDRRSTSQLPVDRWHELIGVNARLNLTHFSAIQLSPTPSSIGSSPTPAA
jgi:hypothetical protein